MIVNILIFLWILFILFMVSLLIRREFVNNMRRNSEFCFQNWEKVDLPYITIDIQGHKLNMITDSAAAVSIITRRAASILDCEPSSRRVSLSALTNDGVNSEVVSISFNVGGKQIKSDFVVYEGDDMANFSKHGILIDGILGVEFFKKTKGKVDFDKQSVIFP